MDVGVVPGAFPQVAANAKEDVIVDGCQILDRVGGMLVLGLGLEMLHCCLVAARLPRSSQSIPVALLVLVLFIVICAFI